MNTYPLDIVAVDVYLLTLTAGKKKIPVKKGALISVMLS